MRFTQTEIPGVVVLDLERREDDRGFFARVWCERELTAAGLSTRIAQINVGFSRRRGTLRGLHYQAAPHREVKIVRCTRGAVWDVAVDLRPDSPTHRKWVGVELDAARHRMLYVPEGCAHGYQTLIDDAEICYTTSEFYAAGAAEGVRYDDPAFGIDWRLEVTALSDADRAWPLYGG